MDVRLSGKLAQDAAYRAAAAEIKKCVHCGMCLAHCPTHIVWGSELDSPRGRIYQVKMALEDGAPTETMRLHLDRCLTCRACESACPSDVQYGKVADAGRKLATGLETPRPLAQRALRSALAHVIGRPRLFGWLLALARPLMFLSPAHKRMFSSPGGRKLPEIRPAAKGRKMALFCGCVQRAAAPLTNRSLQSLFAAAGIDTEVIDSPCCGALDFHLGRHEPAHAIMRKNVEKVRARLESGELEGIVMAASGCSAMLKEYADHLSGDGGDLSRAARLFSENVCDPARVLREQWAELEPKIAPASEQVAYHAPCTQQHWQKSRGVVEDLLERAGFRLVGCDLPELCCGAAGSHFLLYPRLASDLRRRKLDTLLSGGPVRILSSNIGCIMHLSMGTEVSVTHWLDSLAGQLKQ